MKTHLCFLRHCLFMTAAFFLLSTVMAKAQYVGYDYVETFDPTPPPLNGTVTNGAGACLAHDVAEGVLRYDAQNQGGARNGTFTLGSPVNFTNKLIVEFDWYPAPISGGNGTNEGLISFRSGNNVLFTVYSSQAGSTRMGIVAGSLTNVASADPMRHDVLPGSSLSKWYHVKAEIYAGQRICFTITNDEGYNRQVMLPVQSGFSLTGISNIYFSSTRNGGNITWNSAIDNVGIKIADAEPSVPTAAASIVSQYDIIDANGGSTALSASVEPFNASDHTIMWSVDPVSLASVTPGYPSWTATITGLNAGSGTATVRATTADGIFIEKTVAITDSPIPLGTVTVSGPTAVSVNQTITLTAAVGPGNASNQNVTWSSSDVAIATVNATTGVVTGVGAGTAVITATAADGGGASGSHSVDVSLTSITSIELRGARRIFYNASPSTITPFSLTSIIQPSDASITTLNWSTLDPAIATVNSSGQVTLAGGFGKTAIKAEAMDGSGIEGYYYIEVEATNPYDVFSDFESSASPFSGSTSSFQNTRAMYFNAANQSGGRSTTWDLSGAITGGIINVRFDWYASSVVSYPNSGILSVQDGAAGTQNMIISFGFANTPDEPEKSLRYFVGNYTSADAEGPLALGVHLENLTELDRWYTIDLTLDYLANDCSFTIVDRDKPSANQTVNNIPLSSVYPPQAAVKSFFLNGLRTSGRNITITSAIDNFGYKVVDATLPTYEVTGLTVDGMDRVAPGSQMLLYPRVSPGNAANKNVTWASSSPGVATVTVDASGRVLVTGVSAGTTTITATSVEKPLIKYEKVITVEDITIPQRQIEKLDRGLVAVDLGGSVFLSWRLLGTDPTDISFNLYKNGAAAPVNPAPLTAAYTNFTDPTGVNTDTYSVAVLVNNVEIYRSEPATVWDDQYLSIPVEKPTTGHLPDGTPYNNYTIYDGSTADLDGDGQYEIIFLWGPSNMRDNSNDGVTGNVFIDAYKLDGTKLWGSGKYIDLGSNIRAGAHYSPFLVYDFDGDGKAEIIIKTSDRTVDTQGQMIGNDIVHANSAGHIITGPEYLTVFDGATGKELASVPYIPERGNVMDWGDGQGNRSERYLAAVAYLDGVRPSAVMARGYYTRTTLCAWDWDGTNLTQRWLFDTDTPGYEIYKGQGNHNMSVADVDMDGRDEIIYGSLTINSDGTPRYTTGLGHGDAMHVGKLDPSRPGVQMFGVHESPFPYGAGMRDLNTGDMIWGVVASNDIGRGLSADIDSLHVGNESWSSGGLGTHTATGTRVANSIGSVNMAIYWDGDTGRELFDGQNNPSVTKIGVSGPLTNRTYANNNLFTFTGASTNGGTKANPCLQADILGDWREEVILRANNDTELRIYTTVMPTKHDGGLGAIPETGIPTLMHDNVYRLAIAWQNGGYNQPPHAGVFIGYGMPDIERIEGAAVNLTFESNDGVFSDNTTAAKEVNTVTGAIFTIPVVSRDNYDFVGWFTAPSGGVEWDATALQTTDATLYAQWAPHSFSIIFDVSGGTSISPLSVKYGASVGTLPVAVRSGYIFDGWLYNGEPYVDNTIYVVSGNITLTASWALIPDLKITTQPQDAILCTAGLDQTLRVEATGIGLTYQWYRDGVIINGATNSSYTVTNIQSTTSSYYKVVVSDANYSVESATVDVRLARSLPSVLELDEYPTDVLKTGIDYSYAVKDYPDLVMCLWSSSNGTVMFSNSQGLKTNVQFNSLGVDTIKVRFLSRCGVEGSLSLPVSIGSPTGLTPHQEATFVVYPNPTTGRVKVAGLTIGEKIRIYNASSVLVDIYTVTDDEMLIDLSNLASGIYYLRTETKTSTIIKN